MHRSTLALLTCLLLMATGLALLGFATTMSLSPPVSRVAASEDETNAALVRRFYAAANEVLRTGESTPLAAVVAPDLLEHADRPGLPPGRDGLVQYLARLRAAHPALRLEVDEVLTNGDLVSAQVTARAPMKGSLRQGTAAEGGSWKGIDVFRIANGQVTERWSGSDAPTLVQPLARMPLSRWPRRPHVTAVARLTLAPQAKIGAAALPGPGFMVVEVGALTVRGVGGEQVFRGSRGPVTSPPMALTAGTEQVLDPGDVVAFPEGTAALSLHNDGTEPAVVLAVAWLPSLDDVVLAPGNEEALSPGQNAQPSEPVGTPVSSLDGPTGTGALADAMLPLVDGGRAIDVAGITVTPLGSVGIIRAAQVPLGRVVVTLDRVLLAPGASLPPRAATGPTVLAVETGVVGLVPVRETAWVRSLTAQQDGANAGSETLVAAGETAFWDAGAMVLLRGGGDTAGSALLLTIDSDTPMPSTTPLPGA